MSRSLLLLSFVLFGLGCQGQSNPFMRTTVPPPATGVGAPSDPYYNNSGGPQSAPPIGSPQAVPGPSAAVPVVPPPDKRFSQPGGYNFPQGSVNHRKAIDPAPEDYRAGTSAIARGARPRSKLGPTEETTAVASATESKEPSAIAAESTASLVAENDSNAMAQQTETVEPEEVSTVAAIEGESSEVMNAFAESDAPAAESHAAEMSIVASAPTAGPVAATGGASVRIVTAENEASTARVSVDSVAMPSSHSTSPFAATTPSTLTVAPPPTAAPGEASMQVAAGSRPDSQGAGTKSRFYFDRHTSTATAQPAAYLGNSRSAVMFAGGTSLATGVEGSPEGAAAYSHQTSYGWLKGKLEYSTAARRWKLRYIPIDGQTDGHGGSVVLPESPLLANFRAGEMVTVHGTIGTTPAEHGSFSPAFQLSKIERQ